MALNYLQKNKTKLHVRSEIVTRTAHIHTHHSRCATFSPPFLTLTSAFCLLFPSLSCLLSTRCSSVYDARASHCSVGLLVTFMYPCVPSIHTGRELLSTTSIILSEGWWLKRMLLALALWGAPISTTTLLLPELQSVRRSEALLTGDYKYTLRVRKRGHAGR